MNTYLAIRDFGKLGLEGVYRPEDTKRTVIANIISGELPVQVLEIGEPDGLSGLRGHWTDITEDIAIEVRAHFVNIQETPSDELRSWLASHIDGPEVAWPLKYETPPFWTEAAE